MSEEEKEENNDFTEKEKEDEKKFLNSLGVSSTWDILSSKNKKSKEHEEKKEFRGFK